ncbi:MAG TPA: GNAT family N-acetyltransferase [Trebonia sp.]|jgi:RimJ/RimL family protein N-acetyltransferase|nr:GNAT family N-acetyltransferase [Trebonia sp.]
MRIVQGDALNRATTQACFEMVRAAAEVDDPNGPPWSLQRLRGWLEHSPDPNEMWVAVDETTGAYQGWYWLMLPDRENRDRAHFWITVQPSSRRRGVGTALLGHALDRAAAAGRSVLSGGAAQGGAGAAFAAHVGATPGLVEARRVLAVGQLPAGRVSALREQAARAAAGYSLVSWSGRTPDEYLAKYAEVENAMGDAPHEAGEENTVWDADRVREQIDEVRERQGRDVYTLAALHDASGEMAAVTSVERDRDFPQWGHQQITAVTRKHRGHRLGLLVKAAMLDWLAEAEPGIERIVTYNAASNEHMVAINAELGYQLLEPLEQGFELTIAP